MSNVIWPSRFGSTAVTDPLFANVELEVHGGGANGNQTFTDVSSKAHVLTANGNVQHTSGTLIGGENAIKFDGTGDFISTPNAAGFSIGGLDSCVEAYIMLDATGKIHAILSNKPSSSSVGYSFLVTAANKLQFALFSSAGAVLAVVGSTSLSPGTLYHVAATRNAASSSGKVYLDGVQDGTASQTGPMADSSATMFIGHDAASSARDFQGKMNWLRFTVGAERYTAGFTPPSMPLPTS